jgi:hypothetical protein
MHIVNEDHGSIECWLESPQGHRCIMPQRPVCFTVSTHGGLLHIDAHRSSLAGQRALATLTFEVDPRRPQSLALIFAQTDFLRQAGLVAGGYDPPTLRDVVPQQSGFSAGND